MLKPLSKPFARLGHSDTDPDGRQAAAEPAAEADAEAEVGAERSLAPFKCKIKLFV